MANAASDETGTVMLTYFRPQGGYLDKLLPVGEVRYVSGTVQMFDGTLQIVHPDRVVERRLGGTSVRALQHGRAAFERHRGDSLLDSARDVALLEGDEGDRYAAARGHVGSDRSGGQAGGLRWPAPQWRQSRHAGPCGRGPAAPNEV